MYVNNTSISYFSVVPRKIPHVVNRGIPTHGYV